MSFNPSNTARLDNKRIIGSTEDNSTPIVIVTKSYARLSVAACTLLGVMPGVDSVEFVQDTESGSFAFSKAIQSTEEGAPKNGKKVAVDGTISSESIYKRLQEGTTYKLNRFEHESVVYGVLEVDTEAPSVEELEAGQAPAAPTETAESFAVSGEDASSVDEQPSFSGNRGL